jgi:Tfp pilus assembly PilM family ATPase
VFLMGSIARWPGADTLLRSLTELPVTIPRPLAFAPELVSADATRCRPELVVAAGLALRGFLAHA